MKKVNYLFAILLIASAPFFTSCGTDEETTPPQILFNAASGYTTGDVTVPANSAIKIGIIANGTSSDLSRFTFTQSGSTTPIVDSAISVKQYIQNFNLITAPVAGSVKLTFKVTQKDGETSELSLTIITSAPVGGPIKNHTAKILGSYDNNTYGSSFGSADGTVYKMADAKTNAAKIDWMYFYGSANQATIASPNDPTAATVFSDATNGLQTWSVRNDTRFQIVTLPTGLTWDAITTDKEIIPLATGASATKVATLSAGKYVSFNTVSGKMGLIRIEAVTGLADGTITYSVKVQQ